MPDIDEIPWSEHICEVVLSPAERAAYLELFMQLISQNLRLRRSGRGLYDSAEIARLDAIIGNSEGPEEALLKRCCLFATNDVLARSVLPEETTDTRMNEIRTSLLAELQNHCEGPITFYGYTKLAGDLSEDSLSSTRCEQYKNLALDIGEKLKQGLWLRTHVGDMTVHFDALLGDILRHRFGDSWVTQQLGKIVAIMQKSANPEDGKTFYSTLEEVTSHSLPPKKLLVEAENFHY